MTGWEGRILGAYRLGRPLGQGGMAMVYRATDTTLEREVAIKIIVPQGDEVAQQLITARFFVEARAAARIQSRHVAQVLQIGQSSDGELYIVMELLEGKTLAQLLQNGLRLAEGRAVHIGRQIARGMHAAHKLGVIHRDLKPANVMVVERDNEKEVAKILDFGVAKILNENKSLTQAGAVLGTVPFMAPEQILGEPVDARTDVYALGVMLYRMLTGVPLFDPSRMSGLVYHQLHVEPQRPCERIPGLAIRPAVEACVLRCLQKRAADRFASMLELDEALGQALAGDAPVLSGHLLAPPLGDVTDDGALQDVLVPTAPWLRSDSTGERGALSTDVGGAVSTEAVASTWVSGLGSLEPVPRERAVALEGALVTEDDVPAAEDPDAFEHAAPTAGVGDVSLVAASFFGPFARVRTASAALRSLQPGSPGWHKVAVAASLGLVVAVAIAVWVRREREVAPQAMIAAAALPLATATEGTEPAPPGATHPGATHPGATPHEATPHEATEAAPAAVGSAPSLQLGIAVDAKPAEAGAAEPGATEDVAAKPVRRLPRLKRRTEPNAEAIRAKPAAETKVPEGFRRVLTRKP